MKPSTNRAQVRASENREAISSSTLRWRSPKARVEVDCKSITPTSLPRATSGTAISDRTASTAIR